MSIDELGFESEITIPEELYNSFKNTEYNINDITQIIENINGAETLNKLKGLIGLNKLYLLEIKKEEPNQIFNDINTLFNLLENYPEKFKSECFKILTSIEHINFTIEKFIKNEPTDKIVKIILPRPRFLHHTHTTGWWHRPALSPVQVEPRGCRSCHWYRR